MLYLPTTKGHAMIATMQPVHEVSFALTDTSKYPTEWNITVAEYADGVFTLYAVRKEYPFGVEEFTDIEFDHDPTATEILDALESEAESRYDAAHA